MKRWSQPYPILGSMECFGQGTHIPRHHQVLNACLQSWGGSRKKLFRTCHATAHSVATLEITWSLVCLSGDCLKATSALLKEQISQPGHRGKLAKEVTRSDDHSCDEWWLTASAVMSDVITLSGDVSHDDWWRAVMSDVTLLDAGCGGWGGGDRGSPHRATPRGETSIFALCVPWMKRLLTMCQYCQVEDVSRPIQSDAQCDTTLVDVCQYWQSVIVFSRMRMLWRNPHKTGTRSEMSRFQELRRWPVLYQFCIEIRSEVSTFQELGQRLSCLKLLSV